MKKTFTTALTGEEMQSPFGGWGAPPSNVILSASEGFR